MFRRHTLVQSVDLAIVIAVLAALCVPAFFFMVPFNDEWLRMNYLADHSVWQWTVMHAQTWVVRPTAELILGYASLPNTRVALAAHFTPRAFLARFQWMYVALAVLFWLTLYVNAAFLARRASAWAHTSLAFFVMIVCWAMSDELGYAFYWADGYANILIPFTLLTCGLVLLARETLPAAAGGGVLLLLAALGHEVNSIYAVGFLLLTLVLRRPIARPWLRRAILASLALACVAVVLLQLFGEGPSTRADAYFHNTGIRYDFAAAWLNVRAIDPLRAALTCLMTLAAISIYRERLNGLPQRAVDDFRSNRLFWILLALGTLATCFLPLASVGLKKARLAVSYYSVLTELYFVLFGVLLFPMLDRWLDPLFRGYRRRIGSILPLLLVLLPLSKNLASYEQSLLEWKPLRAQANAYMTALFTGNERVHLCRPRHPYVKPVRMMTTRNEAEYFHLNRVVDKCPRM
jgi:hypothetical protein